MKVHSSTPTRLVLGEPRKTARLVMTLGLLLTIAGVLAWVWYLKDTPEHVPLQIHGLPLAGPLVVVFGAAVLYRRKTVDAKRRGIVRHNWFWQVKVQPRESFRQVAVTVIPAEGKQKETVEVRIERAGDGDRAEVIGSMRTTRKSLPLIWAADEISRLLELPLEVKGDTVDGSEEVCAALQELEGTKPLLRAA
jgi:hypothetical protein